VFYPDIGKIKDAQAIGQYPRRHVAAAPDGDNNVGTKPRGVDDARKLLSQAIEPLP
jgi:hypothetical protein